METYNGWENYLAKKRIQQEHDELSGMHNKLTKIRKCKDDGVYFAYWMDGQIERRDTYCVDKYCLIEVSHYRYANETTWRVAK